jgi:DNA-binding LacI/PurR family transcriptional regulator
MLGYITRSAASLGYDVLVSLQQLSDDWHIEYQASHRADGLILMGYGDYLTYREKLAALADAHTRFIIWGPIVRDQPGHSFGCDNESGGFQATDHLIRLGRRRIALVGNPSRRSPEHAARYAGYLAAHRKSGLSHYPELMVKGDNSEALGYQAAQTLLEREQQHPFDAIFAATDLLAIGAMRALQDAGRRVPEEVSIVGFDDVPLASHVTPGLTTVQQNAQEAGEGLVKAIVALIRGGRIESTLMAPHLVVRQSCGARLRQHLASDQAVLPL